MKTCTRLLCSLWIASCADELDLGEDRCSGVECAEGAVNLFGNYTATSARAEDAAPVSWSLPWQTAMYVPALGSLWTAEAQGEALRVRRLDAEGVLQEPLSFVSPDPLGSMRSVRLLGMTPDARGPVVYVAWLQSRTPGVSCDQADVTVNSTRDCIVRKEALLFDRADLANPQRVELCRRASRACLPGPVVRSGDGQRLLVTNGNRLEQISLDGRPIVTARLPAGFTGMYGPAIDARRWLSYGFSLSATPAPSEPFHGLISIDDTGKPSLYVLQGVNTDDVLRGGVEPGTKAGEAIVFVERHASSLTDAGTSNAIADEGDIAVLRLLGAELQSQQVLAREEYVNLQLDGYAADVLGNAYVATATGDRGARDGGMLTPLLCRLPPIGPGRCFLLRERAQRITSIAPNVVLVQSAQTLIRYDLP